MAWRVERWGDPWGGGWMEWPAGMRQRMETAQNTYNLLQRAQSIPPGGMARWATENPDANDSLHKVLALVEAYDNDDTH